MDTYDYQRSSLPSRLPAPRGASLPSRVSAAPAGEGTSPSPLSARAVLRASRRYWWLILALWTVGVSGTGAAIYLKVRPKYRAMSLLKVDPNVMELYGMSNSGGGSSYMQTYVELIRSPSVFSRALIDEKVGQLPLIRSSSDPMQELAGAIQVGIRPSTTIIEVSMTGNSQAEAATIVNAVVAAFLDYNRSWSGNAVKAQIGLLETHAKTLKAESDLVTGKLKELAARGTKVSETRVVREPAEGVDQGSTRASDTGMNVSTYQRMVENVMEVQTNEVLARAQLLEVERAAKEAQNLASVGAPPKNQLDPLVELRVDSDSNVQSLVKAHRDAYSRYEAAKRKAVNQGDPGVVAAANTANRLNAEVAKARAHARLVIQSQPGGAGDVGLPNLAREVQRLRAEVHHLELKRETLDKQLKSYKVETNKQNYDEVDARILEDHRRRVESNAYTIRNKLESLRVEQMNDERIIMIDKAREEGSPASDKRKLYLAAMPFGVLGVVLALAILLEIRSGRVADTEFLSARLPHHEVFAIAPLPSARGALGIRGDRSEQGLARFVQSLDHLRVALCEGGSNGEGRCVMITSATGGEGKTTLSVHLAARCANAGTATLLIDADLRRGSLGRLLDVPAGPGLGDVLAGQVELDGGLITTQAGGFHFLSAGTPGIDPTRVLRSTRLAELIGQLRQMYDLILIDTPPVLPVADALILGRWSDGAVMATRYDASRVPMVERANRQIAAAGIPVLGVVVNGVQGQDQVYGNYAYNYDYPGSHEPLDDGVVAS